MPHTARFCPKPRKSPNGKVHCSCNPYTALSEPPIPFIEVVMWHVVTATALVLAGVLLACGPSSAEDHNRAGVRHFEAGRVEEAIAAYSEAIRLDPDSAQALYNRGQAYFTIGQPEKAVSDFSRAIEVDPADRQVALAYAGRAMAYTLMGNDDDAQSDFASAVRGGFEARRLLAMIEEIKAQR